MRYVSWSKKVHEGLWDGTSGSQARGQWDTPSDSALKHPNLDPKDNNYDQEVIKPVSLIFCEAMKTAEKLDYEMTQTRFGTARALEMAVANIEKAEDLNESNAFKVFRDPH